MTLDPVSLDGIAGLARHVRRSVDATEHGDLATEVWENFLDPLYEDDEAVLEPVGDVQRYHAAVEDLGLQADPYDAVHALDSGTTNPQPFKNGLVVDVAQAAMSATPSELDLHRARTVVKGVHSNDATVTPGLDWQRWDDDYVRGRVIEAPDVTHVRPSRVVHWLALYRAESEHALEHADAVDELLVLDGPLYPKELANWADRTGGLSALVADVPAVRTTVENYLALVERFVERDVPLAGFVKSGASTALLDALGDRVATPWATDLALFAQVLERREDDERVTDELAWTNWFVSRLGADGAFGGRTDLGVDRALDPEAYEVAFFVVYDPRPDLAFRVELPWAFAREESVRKRVRDLVLRDVAAEMGPPTPVQKADALARIDRGETASLLERLATALDSEPDRSYDVKRWG